jgi:putative membrane protein
MKTLYVKSILNSMQLVIVTTILVSCSSSLTYQEAVSKNERKIEDPEMRSDARFLVEAKSFNLLEMRLTENAVTSGYASAIVDLARTQLQELEDMNDDIDELGRKEKIALPTAMSDQHQSNLFQVTSTDRQDFDRDFIMTMKRINDENKEQYLNMATEAKDADVRAFAARKLDMLRNHATHMEEVEKQLMNTY